MSLNVHREKVRELQFAKHLLRESTGYDEDDVSDSLAVINMFIRRAEKKPQQMDQCYNAILLELKMYDIGCLRCAYRDFKYKGEE